MMSAAEPHPLDARLLDLHLGVLSTAEQAELRRQIAADPALAARDEALRGVFRALASVRDERAPADLAARTMGRVRSASVPALTVHPAEQMAPELAAILEERPERVIRLGSLRDVVAIAALVVLVVGLGVPGLLHLRDRNQRYVCSTNLANLGFAMQQYASSFGDALPFSGFDRQRDRWQPTGERDVALVPNRRHMYPLLRLKFVPDPRLFICPSQQHVAMRPQDVGRFADFPESRNVSYPYQNMAGVRPSASDAPDLPIMADETPYFVNGVPLFTRLQRRDPAVQNSRAHGGAGQNLLTIGGHVKWATTPLAGIGGDNIWTIDGVEQYTGREGPATATDAHLLK